MTDPIADMLTRIRNAQTARHEKVEVPSSKAKRAIADILLSEGYVESVDFVEDGYSGKLVIGLKYGANGVPVARFQARPAQLCGRGNYAQSTRRAGYGDRFHLQRDHDR